MEFQKKKILFRKVPNQQSKVRRKYSVKITDESRGTDNNSN